MSAALVTDVGADEWARNAHVIAAPEPYSHVASGVYVRDLKVPVTPDRVACLARHQFFAASKYAAAFASAEVAAALERQDAAACAGVAFTAIANHWHLVIDGLGCLRELPGPARRALLVDSEFSDAQIEFVQRFAAAAGMGPFAAVQRMPPGVHRFDDVVFPTRRLLSDRVRWVRTVLGTGSSSPPRGKRVFMLRNGAATRRLLNQEAIAARLRSDFGFEVLDPAAMSLDAQVRELRDASVVVGPHGAALTNFVFAARPAMLVELFHTEMQVFYHALCQVLGARHYAIRGTPVSSTSDGARADNADFVADEGEVAKVIGSLLAAA